MVRDPDYPKTDDGVVHVQQAPNAVYDGASGQWHVQLTCGVFSDLGQPATDAVWMVSD